MFPVDHHEYDPPSLWEFAGLPVLEYRPPDAGLVIFSICILAVLVAAVYRRRRSRKGEDE